MGGRSKYRWLHVDEKDERDKDTNNETFLEILVSLSPYQVDNLTNVPIETKQPTLEELDYHFNNTTTA